MSDFHAGSTTGLAPDEPIPHPEGLSITPTPVSRYLWGIYTQQLEAERASRDRDAPGRTGLVLVGDICDGLMHHGQIQLYHPASAVEDWIARRIVKEAVEVLEPDDIFLVAGSPSHVGALGRREESVGAWLTERYGDRLQRPNAVRYTWPILQARFGGVLTDVRHHGKLGQLPHTRESYQKRYAFDIWSSQAMYKDAGPIAALALRAHRHKFADSGPIAPHRNGTRLISLPCYQMTNEWAASKAFEEGVDVGMVGISMEAERVRDVEPHVVYPRIVPEEAIWTP